jgi:hypothetical protein
MTEMNTVIEHNKLEDLEDVHEQTTASIKQFDEKASEIINTLQASSQSAQIVRKNGDKESAD